MKPLVQLLAFFVVLEVLAARSPGQEGPPVPRAPQGGYSFGFGAGNVSEQWTYGNQVDSVHLYFEASRAIGEYAEIFGRLGWSNSVINEGLYVPLSATASDLSPNAFTPLLGAGIRSELFTHGSWTIGGTVSAVFHSEFTEYVSEYTNVYHRTWIHSISEYNATLTAITPIRDALFYFGPTVHFAYLDGVTEQFEVQPDQTNISRRIVTIRDKGSIAGVAGVQMPIHEVPVIAEIRIGDSISGGISIFYPW